MYVGYMDIHVHVCTRVCGGQRSTLKVILTLYYSHGTWNSEILLDWLASVLAHPELGSQTWSVTLSVYVDADEGSELKFSCFSGKYFVN